MADELEAAAAIDRHKLLVTKWFGVALIPLSFVAGYYLMAKPLAEAKQTGLLEYSVKGIMLPPLMFFMGVALLFTDLRDKEIRSTDADGKRKLTRKGWLVTAGAVVICVATYAVWSYYVGSLGFKER